MDNEITELTDNELGGIVGGGTEQQKECTKNNILQQAAQTMLSQANQQKQGVLQLLQ